MTAKINIPQWDGTPREAGEVWSLRKREHVASCHLWTHPKDGEVRLTVDGEWHRGQALSDGLALVELALEWREQFERKGWGVSRPVVDVNRRVSLRPSATALLGERIEHFGQRDLQRTREPADIQNPDVALTALDSSDVVTVQACTLGQLLLG